MNLDALSRLAMIADGQWGQVTLAQAHAAGLTPELLAELQGHDLVEEVISGVVRLRAGGRHPYPRLYAAWLSLDPGQPAWQRTVPECGVVSHHAAVRMYRTGDLPGPAVEFTVPEVVSLSASAGAVLHRASLSSAEWQEIGGLPVTRPGRTLRDVAVAGVLEVPELGRLARALVSSRWTTEDELASALDGWRERSGWEQLTEFLDAAKEGA